MLILVDIHRGRAELLVVNPSSGLSRVVRLTENTVHTVLQGVEIAMCQNAINNPFSEISRKNGLSAILYQSAGSDRLTTVRTDQHGRRFATAIFVADHRMVLHNTRPEVVICHYRWFRHSWAFRNSDKSRRMVGLKLSQIRQDARHNRCALLLACVAGSN